MFFDKPVLLCVSQSFGYMVVVIKPIARLPLIVGVITARSAHGISKVGTLIEIFGYAIFTSFAFSKKYSFNTWGEGLLSLIQLAFLHFLIWFYQKKTIALIFLVLFFITVVVLMSGLIPDKIHSILFLYFYNSSIILGKIIQVYVNYRNRHTGNLSPLSSYFSLYCAVIRIFTSMIQTKDWRMVLSYSLISITNIILVIQFIIYAKNTEKFLRQMRKKKLTIN